MRSAPVAHGQQRGRHNVVLDQPPQRLAIRGHKELLVGVHNVVPLRAAQVVLRHGAVQYSTVQYSTVQYSTVQYSFSDILLVRYSAVQERGREGGAGLCPSKRGGLPGAFSDMVGFKIHSPRCYKRRQGATGTAQVLIFCDYCNRYCSRYCIETTCRYCIIKYCPHACGRCRLISSPSKSALKVEQLA